MIDAWRLRQVDEDRKTHWLAYLIFAAKSMKKAGKKQKPVYSTFKKFYDYKKELKRVREYKQDSRLKGIGNILRKGGD